MHILMDVAASGAKLPFDDNVVTAILGYGTVFAGLMVLMGIICGMGGIFKAASSRAKPMIAAPTLKIKKTDRDPEPVGEPARGSAGEIKLHNVSNKEAAMIMAIVASQMGKPLNELRFKSIKEVKEDEI